MGDWKDAVFFPFRIFGAMAKITGRITIGAVGFVLMGAGLLLISFHFPLYIGLPIIVIGLLLLARAVF